MTSQSSDNKAVVSPSAAAPAVSGNLAEGDLPPRPQKLTADQGKEVFGGVCVLSSKV